MIPAREHGWYSVRVVVSVRVAVEVSHPHAPFIPVVVAGLTVTAIGLGADAIGHANAKEL